MGDDQTQAVSRRHWLGAASIPVMAGAMGAAISGGSALGADVEKAAGAPVGANSSGARVYNIRDFGATGDGKTLDTAAIQGAIDACTADHGGVVLVPGGTFLISPIELKSNVTLHIAAGGTLLATTDAKQYQPARGIPLSGDHTMGDGNVGLVYGANAENITIEGPGTIDGQGAEVRAGGLGGNKRPHLVLFYKCKNLTVRNVYLYRSAYHTCRICNSSYVQLDGVRIFSRVTGNNDGFHFISAEYVNISNCNVRCQDDACALFGSCKFVMVTNSLFSTRWSVFRFGGGVAENIVVSNCLLYQVYGCPIKLRCEPGSRYENMSFSNLVLQDVTGPISIGAGPMREGGAGQGAVVRNISFSNISGNVVTKETKLDDSNVTGANRPGEQHSCIIVNCVEGNTIENISFSDIRLTFGGGGTAEDAARRDLPKLAGEYFALGPMPAYGLYARNARGLSLRNIRFEVSTPDLRPAIIFDGVHDAAVNGLSVAGNADAESVLRLRNTREMLISAPRLLSPAAAFARVEGKDSADITVDGGDITKAAKAIDLADGAERSEVRLRTGV